MSSLVTESSFVYKFINKNPFVSSTKLDAILKGTINNFKGDPSYSFFVTYLNKLRIVYFLKRLSYKNASKTWEYKGKSFNSSY